jgi:predicted ester cyclase
MGHSENTSLEHRWYEAFNKGRDAAMAVMDELLADDFVLHCGSGHDIRGLEDNKKNVSGLFDMLPDIHFIIDDMVAEGDKMAVRYTMSGTSKGNPTKKVSMWSIQIDRFAGGKFVEAWERFDTLGFMQQLGYG